MEFLILIAAVLFVIYGYEAWRENRTVEPPERVLHFAFRIGPLVAIGLLALASTGRADPRDAINRDDVPIVLTRPVQVVTAHGNVKKFVNRIVCVRSGFRVIPVIERLGGRTSRTLLVRCPL